MYTSINSILLGLGGKCLLNWLLVFFQKKHICRSFLAAFSASLAVFDAALTLTFTILRTRTDGYVVLFGHLLTSYHMCLLVQIVGQIHRVLQWPVVVMAAVDHFCTVTQRLHANTARAKRVVYLFVTVLLWCLAALYVFLLSDFTPVLEDVSHHHMHRCWVFPSSQTLHITLLLLLTLSCTALHAGRFITLSFWIRALSQNSPLTSQTVDQSQTHSRGSFVQQAVCKFVLTRSLFLVFLAVLLLLPVGIPSHLDLNVAWLCFLNSLLVALVLCAVCPASQISLGLAAVPPDSFCEWKF
ncbi:putative G-protein coupled receptor 160 [Odontesthes bonariensis]|uniref:putative G-protein coupled receptor 160 n=1 Tax=Odontesthes bonariensis TaxID=219752 RepID=UPI003F581B6C